MTLRVVHLSTYAGHGGAGRAASALHTAMLRQGVESSIVHAGGKGFSIARLANAQLSHLQRSPVQTWRSPARFGSMTARQVDALDADVVNLHWVTDGFLTVETIGQVKLPTVWSMYDMWPFTGTEHYGVDTPTARWRSGYTRGNRPGYEAGIDLDRMTWERKRRAWSPMHMVPASSWLASATRESALMGRWPVTRIPHVVDELAFEPMPRAAARESLGLSEAGAVVTFLSSGGTSDHRKGFDLLEQALPSVIASVGPVTVLVVGPRGQAETAGGANIVWIGSVSTDAELRRAYCAADVVAVPSREDNMPLSAMEAQTCGRAVVGFDIGGLADIVVHQESGFLAPSSDVAELSTGLIQAIEDARGPSAWGRVARERALATWASKPVVAAYLDLYEAECAR